MITIDKNRLKTLFDEKSSFFNRRNIPVDGYFAEAVFLFGLLTGDLSRIDFFKDNQTLKTIIEWFFWLVFIAYAIYLIVLTVIRVKNKYTLKDLESDILKISKENSAFSLLIIKNKNNPLQYLQCYDKRWKSYLFLYLHTNENEDKNIEKIKTFVCSNLNVAVEDVNIRFLFEKSHEKYSIPNKITRKYNHRFYEIDLSSFKNYKNNTFHIRGNKYTWMTLEEMMDNKTIMKKNSDIVGFIREYYN